MNPATDYEIIMTAVRTMTNNDATNLILGHNSVHQEADSHKNPGQPRCLEYQKSEETQ